MAVLKKVKQKKYNIRRLKKKQNMYKPSLTTLTLENCITMQNRLPLNFVPKQYTTYFINSKRRFFLYFKYRDQMNQVIKIFQKQNIRFHQRKSIFPDRQEQQQIVFHSNYKYKKKDLRWALSRDTRIREPINRFNDKKNQYVKQASQESKEPYDQELSDRKNLSNKETLNSKSQIELKLPTQMQIEQTSTEIAADFGYIKLKNPEVLDLLNNLELMKALFKSQKRK